MRNEYIVSSSQMKQLDQLTMKEKGISSFELMKRAGNSMCHYLIKTYLVSMEKNILVIAGTGNNGGDTLVIATNMFNKGFNISVVLVGKEEQLTEEAKVVWGEIREVDVEQHLIDSIESLDEVMDLFIDSDIIIDGIFGIGLTREVEGHYKGVISMINHSKASVISIDIPSGINADNGLVYGIAVKANHTLIVQHHKQGNLLGDAMDYSGERHLIDVGIIPPKSNIQLLLNDPNEIDFEPRKHNSHKYHYGCVLTVGGSKGMSGAPILAAYASLRTGSGLSKVLYHEQYLHYINNPYPSLMVDTYENIDEYDFSKVSSIVFGPGLGRNDDYNINVLQKILKLDIPIVIDADGIYYIKEILDDYEKLPNVVITPHCGEMALLLGITSKDVLKDPVLYARTIADKHQVTVVLKGATTVITNGTDTYFSNVGNPGMATAGSGDILSGIIGSILGRKYSSIDACKIGVLIHSIASNFTAKEKGIESLIASDIGENIYKVLK